MQIDEDIMNRFTYFSNEDQCESTVSKIVQTNSDGVFVIGGYKFSPSLLTHTYNVPRSCLFIDLSTGIISEKSQLISGRSHFGVSHITNYIYVVGGWGSNGEGDMTCERYSIPNDKWEKMPENSVFD